jgi:hypothetical protein
MNIDRIIASLPSKTAEERAQLRRNAERLRDSGPAAQRPNAVRLLDAIAAYETDAPKQRAERLGSMTLTGRVIEAFRTTPLKEGERRLVQVLLDRPGASSAELAAALGSRGGTWHLGFGSMCKLRRADLWPGEWVERRNAEFYCGILADAPEPENLFTMKPEAVEAFAAMGIKGRQS